MNKTGPHPLLLLLVLFLGIFFLIGAGRAAWMKNWAVFWVMLPAGVLATLIVVVSLFSEGKE